MKLLAAFPCAFLVALAETRGAPLAALAGAGALAAAARLSPPAVLKSVKPLLIFLGFLWIVLPLSVPGVPLFSLGLLRMSREGAGQAFLISVKSLAVVLLVISLLGTSSVTALMHALRHLRVSPKLLFLAFLTFRYVFVIQVEYQRLRNAMRARGFTPGTNLHTYKSYAYLVGMLLIRSFERSERVYRAMLCRGFRGEFFILDHFVLHRRDVYFAAAMVLFMAALGWLSWMPVTSWLS
jgi:cobalt/nickel transport system permease protein